MTKPTVFSVLIKGSPRKLFYVQERLSGDLTLIVKQSIFRPEKEFGPSSALDTIVEEHFSIHISPDSDSVNVIKYTQLLNDGRRHITRNYTESIKLHNQFTGLIVRRAGDLSEDRYLIKPHKGIIVSIGSYDLLYFQPVYFVIVGPRDRPFVSLPASKINVIQKVFRKFRLVILWQFLVFTGGTTIKSFIQRTFSQDEIASADPTDRPAMAAMSKGFSDLEAIGVFNSFEICDSRHFD